MKKQSDIDGNRVERLLRAAELRAERKAYRKRAAEILRNLQPNGWDEV